MARLVGVDLPREKRLEIALTYIFGMGRTRASADILMERLRAAGAEVPASYHDALMERHCGDWEGMTVREIQDRFPENWAAREQDGLGSGLSTIRRALQLGVHIESSGVQHGDQAPWVVAVVGHRDRMPVGAGALDALTVTGLEGRQ